MSNQAKPLRDRVDAEIEELQSLRDEIRVKLHLAGMEAKDAWAELEPRIERLEGQVAREGAAVADATLALAKDLSVALKSFRERL